MSIDRASVGDVLRQYADAWELDQEADALAEDLAEDLRTIASAADTNRSLTRSQFALCPHGRGHWVDWCSDRCVAPDGGGQS